MGNTSGALGFVEGLMGGMQRREEHDRSKKIDKLLDQKSQQNLLSDVGAYETHLNEGGDAENWVFQNQDKDPFLMRQMKKLGNWMTGTEPKEEVDPYAAAREKYANRDVAEGSMSPVANAPSGRLVDYADGGRVAGRDRTGRTDESENYAIPPPRRDRRGRDLGSMDMMDVPGYRPPDRRQREEELEPRPVDSEPLFPRTRAIAGEVRRENEHYAAEEGDSAYTRGSKWMDRTQNNIRGFLGGAVAFGRDMVDNVVPDAAADAVQGALGYKGHEDYEGKPRQAVPAEAPTPAPAQAVPTQPEDTTAAVTEAVATDQAPDAQVAANAVQAGAEATPGHPDHPDQQFNFAAMAKEGWTAADIAHVPLKDWNEYRQNHVLASIKQGKSVVEANQEVDTIQYDGFMRNFRQASYLMMAGDESGAALAARAAYQYFPNGTDIRFQAMVGKDGQDYLVAAGFDEKTGEMRGEPQVMTPDYVNAMLANFEDPKSFNAWKADKEEAYRLERQYNEIEKPTAQADLDLKGAQADYYRSGAQKNRAEARGEQFVKPLTEAEKRAAGAAIDKDVAILALEDPELARQLKATAIRIYTETRTEPEVIMNEIHKLYKEGGLDALNELLAEWAE